MPGLHEYEQHFNNLQMKLRTIASTWMLASFGAIAFLLTNAIEAEAVFNRFNLINAISAMTVVAMFVLWQIDQLAYQRLLDCCLVVDLASEHGDPRIPPLKTVMALAAGHGMNRHYRWFYFLPMVLFTAISVIALLLNLHEMPLTYDFYAGNLAVGLMFLGVKALVWLVAVRRLREVGYTSLALAFHAGGGPPPAEATPFEALFDERRERMLREIVGRHLAALREPGERP